MQRIRTTAENAVVVAAITVSMTPVPPEYLLARAIWWILTLASAWITAFALSVERKAHRFKKLSKPALISCALSVDGKWETVFLKNRNVSAGGTKTGPAKRLIKTIKERELYMRIFMGHHRTTCDCDLCAANCRFIPGYLLPEDLTNIPLFLSYSELFEFAEKNLLASPGALVMKNGKVLRIRTIVPARDEQGWCRFFDGSLCTIHPVAPFGCAFFDAHQAQSESNTISAKGLEILARLWENQPRSLYCQVWNHLYRKGMQAPAPEECRNRMREHQMEKKSRTTQERRELHNHPPLSPRPLSLMPKELPTCAKP
jgi:hypothetical protein